MQLSNCPNSCLWNKCFNLSPKFEYCSTHCERQHAAQLKAEEEQALAEMMKKKKIKKSTKLAVETYPIGTGDGISKSVHFLANDETVFGNTLDKTPFKINDTVFQVCRFQDE